MKNLIINSCIKYIKKNTDYNETKLKEIEYGLVGIYLTISKAIIIFTLAAILGIFKEMIIFSILFNIIRMPAFGLHATKSWICLVSSLFIFIVIPVICSYIYMNILIKAFICSFNILLIFKNAPADTKKRPIVNKKRRQTYKTISTIIAICFSYIAVLINNNIISNCLVFALMLENCLISPIVYRLFKLPYNNYITFLKEHPGFSQ